MNCAWKELLSILPPRMRSEVDRLGRETLQEIRLRMDKPVMLICAGSRREISHRVTQEDLSYVVNMACRYSPWTAASAASGYITASGGHRIGLCGDAVVSDGVMTGIRTLRSLNIRVARDFPDICRKIADISGSILILGRPGSGKTTLLRDLIRQISQRENVSVVDERGELFPAGFASGPGTDILTGCDKKHGIDTVLRTMTPDTIAVDEVTQQADCTALLQAGWCGVRLLATAHASSVRDLYLRKVYEPLIAHKLFDTVVILQADKSFRTERMTV